MTNADWICIPAEATFFDDLCECLKTSKERFDAGRYRKAANDLNQNLFHWMNECILLYGRRVSSHSDTLRNVYPAVDDEDSGEETGSASGDSQTGPSMRAKIFQCFLAEEAEYDDEEVEYQGEEVEYQGEPDAMQLDVAPPRHPSPAPCNDFPLQVQIASPAASKRAVLPPPKTAANLGFDDVIEVDYDDDEV